MYQMYAYGQKYSKTEIEKIELVLVYSATENFESQLDPFVYDKNKNKNLALRLSVKSFDFEKSLDNEKVPGNIFVTFFNLVSNP